MKNVNLVVRHDFVVREVALARRVAEACRDFEVAEAIKKGLAVFKSWIGSDE